MNVVFLENLKIKQKMKIINIILIACSLFCIAGCHSKIAVYHGGEAIPNQEANTQLRKLQNIQTLQFECLEHPEYRISIPNIVKSQYTTDEIKQAFKNLNWEYVE